MALTWDDPYEIAVSLMRIHQGGHHGWTQI